MGPQPLVSASAQKHSDWIVTCSRTEKSSLFSPKGKINLDLEHNDPNLPSCNALHIQNSATSRTFNEYNNNLLDTIKTCAKQKNLKNACLIHSKMLTTSFIDIDNRIESALITMYANCSALEEAEDVFYEILDQNVASWNALIAGYAHNGLGYEALKCFMYMQECGLLPNAITFACILKCFAHLGFLAKGEAIHSRIICLNLFKTHVALVTSLMDMYAKCRAIIQAKYVFDELCIRDVVSWNAMITGYNYNGDGVQALNCFKRMLDEGLCPNVTTFACVLKACSSAGSIKKGEEIHAGIKKPELLEKHVMLSSALVDMYVKCGSLEKAEGMFDEFPIRDTVTWTALIGGYVLHGLGSCALKCFQQMQEKGISPNAVTFTCTLNACGLIGSAEKGAELHAEIMKHRLLDKNVMLGDALADMYAKCGSLTKAQEVFNSLPIQNVASWNALIAGYVRHGHYDKALKCFKVMKDQNVIPNANTYTCILKACGTTKSFDIGETIDMEIRKHGLLQKEILLGTALLDMYMKCGAVSKAQKSFDDLVTRNAITWTALISGYVQHGFAFEALNCFNQMKAEGFSPTPVTFACIFAAYSTLGLLEKGEKLHMEVRKEGMLQNNIVLTTTVINMYVKCGSLSKAQAVFNELHVRDIVSWNTLISGYADHGFIAEVLNCLGRMVDEGFCPTQVTYSHILKACGHVGSVKKGDVIHVVMRAAGFLEENISVNNTLIDMYGKCGAHIRAQNIFDGLLVRDVVSWNALIACYAHNGYGYKAIECYDQMQNDGIIPDAITLACILKAYASIGCADKGEEIHDEIERQGLLETNVILGNALVDMYVKCGNLAKAEYVFDRLPQQDVVSWNSIILGYAHIGEWLTVLRLFSKMISEDVVPDVVTFVVVLTACSHGGLADEGPMYFDIMVDLYCLTPSLEHYTCLIDLFSRAGHFEKALFVIKRLSCSNYLPLWSALLAGCQKWVNVDIGRQTFEHLIRLDKTYALAYVSMRNIYIAAGMHDEAAKVENLRIRMVNADVPKV